MLNNTPVGFDIILRKGLYVHTSNDYHAEGRE